MSAPKKILCVDDDALNLEIMEYILRDQHVVLLANSGEKAVEVARRELPDVVFLDVMMPGMDGYEVCRRLRAMPALATTRIVLVSARALLADRLQGLEAGADEYLAKPFEENELLARVHPLPPVKLDQPPLEVA